MENRDKFRKSLEVEPDREDVRRLPLDFCLNNYCVVLEFPSRGVDKAVRVGMLHPDDPETVTKIEEEVGREIETIQLNGFQLRQAIAVGYDVAPRELSKKPVLALGEEVEISFAEEQSPTRILSSVLSEAVRRQASDVHLENYGHEVDVRFRVDGILKQVSSPVSPENIKRIISKLKVMAELDITERHQAQDGHFTVSYEEEGEIRTIDIRLNVLPGPYGQDAALRILDKKQFILDYEHLGMDSKFRNLYRELLNRPDGILLAVGPTGAGKTTTLYCAINELVDAEKKIITAEDPIEYEFEKVNQKQVSQHMDFPDYVRAFLRQDPDIIMIGEIRDVKTAQNCLRAGNTGHLVLSTLHTGNSVTAISRLRSLEVNNDHLAEALNGIIAQRLVRKICPDCKKKTEPPEWLIERFYGEAGPDHPFYTGEGCKNCEGSGYRGREGVFEFLIMDRKLRELIAEEASTETIWDYVHKTGFRSIYQHALEKIEKGKTTLQEVARVIAPPMYTLEY